jgi:hypothetical protein
MSSILTKGYGCQSNYYHILTKNDLKNDVIVPSKSNKQKNLEKKFLLAS